MQPPERASASCRQAHPAQVLRPRLGVPSLCFFDAFGETARCSATSVFTPSRLSTSTADGAPSVPRFGLDVGPLVSRFRSSQYLAAHSDANFGIKGTLVW